MAARVIQSAFRKKELKNLENTLARLGDFPSEMKKDDSDLEKLIVSFENFLQNHPNSSIDTWEGYKYLVHLIFNMFTSDHPNPN